MISALIALTATQVSCTSFPHTSLEGRWLSRGYGYYFEIEGDQIDLFEVTSMTCVPSVFNIERVSSRTSGDWFVEFVGTSYSARIARIDADKAMLKVTSAASVVNLDRVLEPPEVCGRPLEDTPINNFAVLWHTFNEHYPFFRLKGVDWLAVRSGFRVAPDMSQEHMFEKMVSLIRPLEDAHTGVMATTLQKHYDGMKSDPLYPNIDFSDEAKNELYRRLSSGAELVEDKYVDGQLRRRCNQHLRFGLLQDGIGYLYLDLMTDLSDSNRHEDNLAELEAALDEAFSLFADVPGVVIDLRNNGGGSDALSLAVAARFTDREYIAYSKVARVDAQDPTRFTRPQASKVDPGTGPRFTGPVALLTSQYTISAGESLTQALMGRRPSAIRVGAATQGVFSDPLLKTLPNGWLIRLPNEKFLDRMGRSFDEVGIEPDIEVRVFHPDDIAARIDPALERAIAELSGV